MSERSRDASAAPNGRSARVPRVTFAEDVARATSEASTPQTPGSKSSTFGLDIGGTLAKVVYFEPDDIDLGEGATRKVRDFIFHTTKYGSTGKREKNRCIYVPALRGTMHFIKFQTSRVPSAIAMMRKYGLYAAATDVFATGGGAMKFADTIQDTLGVTLRKFDELDCLVRGVSWLCLNVPQELYRVEGFKFSQEMKRVPLEQQTSLFPFLIVNVGSGVSMLNVSSHTDFERVGGTSLGGATFYGLVSLLTGCDSFEEALMLAEEGDNKKIDMLVRDIYGGDYDAFNLRGTAVASSFGKMLRSTFRDGASKADLARATLLMVTNNIGSIAHMHAKQIGTTRIIFSGNFMLKNRIAHRTLSYAIDFWSGGAKQALFLRHEGYSGAVGALLYSFEKHAVERRQSIGMVPRPELVRSDAHSMLASADTPADEAMAARFAAAGSAEEGGSDPSPWAPDTPFTPFSPMPFTPFTPYPGREQRGKVQSSPEPGAVWLDASARELNPAHEADGELLHPGAAAAAVSAAEAESMASAALPRHMHLSPSQHRARSYTGDSDIVQGSFIDGRSHEDGGAAGDGDGPVDSPLSEERTEEGSAESGQQSSPGAHESS